MERAMVRPSRRAIQVGLGVFWMVDGLLQLQPKMFGPAFAAQVISPSASGQPGAVAWPIDEMARLLSVQPAAANTLFAMTQLLIGLGMMRRETVRPALAISFVWAACVWWFGEGLGMLLTGTASPLTGAPGAVLLYAVVGVVVWPRRHAPDETAPARSPAAHGVIGERGALGAWAVLWLGMAALWLLPANDSSGSLGSALTSASGASPSWLAGFQVSLGSSLATEGTLVALLLAACSVVIAVGPLVSRHRALFLVAGAALSIDFWVLGQSFGGLTTGTATDVNAGPLFVLLALALFPSTEVASAGVVCHGDLSLPRHGSAAGETCREVGYGDVVRRSQEPVTVSS